MYNILLIDEDYEYGNKLMNDFNNYNSDIRFCAYIYHNNEVDEAIKKYNYDIVLIDSNILYEYYSQLEKYKNQMVLLVDSKEKLKNIGTLYILKSDSIVRLNEIIFKSLLSSAYDENFIRETIKKELQYLGYKNKYYGTKYLVDAIYILFCNKEEYSNDNLEKCVYPIISKKYRKTIQNIKCNIVNATDNMVYDCEEKRLMQYLGYFDYEKPGPKRIIEAVVSKLNEKYIDRFKA